MSKFSDKTVKEKSKSSCPTSKYQWHIFIHDFGAMFCIIGLQQAVGVANNHEFKTDNYNFASIVSQSVQYYPQLMHSSCQATDHRQKSTKVKSNFNSYYFGSQVKSMIRLNRDHSAVELEPQQRRRKGISLSVGRSKSLQEFYPDWHYPKPATTCNGQPRTLERAKNAQTCYFANDRGQHYNIVTLLANAQSDPYQLSSAHMAPPLEQAKHFGDSRITTQMPSKVPSKCDSILTMGEGVGGLARSLDVRRRMTESEVEYGIRSRKPIFNKKLKQSALKNSQGETLGKISLKDAPLYYSIVVDDRKGL